MNTKIKIMAAVAIAALVTNFAEAKVWRMNNNAGINADFSSFTQAFAKVSANDTIYLEGSSVSYGTVDLKMPLTIIGTGYFLSQNPNTQANPVSAMVDQFTFDTGSNGSALIGIYETNTGGIYINISNITIRKCYLPTISFNNGAVNTSNFIISQNYIYYNNIQISSSSGTVDNIIISNNYIQGAISLPTVFSGTISNNIIYGGYGINVYNFIISNNIVYSGAVTLNNDTYFNNIGSGTQFPTGNGNQQNVTMSNVFVGTGSTDGQWELAANSPALKAGTNGTDIGMFGGIAPYVLSGMPEIPSVYQINMPSTGYTTDSIKVNLKAIVH